MNHLPAILLIVLLLLAACGHNPPSGRGATPEEAAMRVIPQLTNPPPKSIQLHGTQVTPYGTAVIFSTDQARLGYVLTEQQGATWSTIDMNLWLSYPPGERSAFVRFGGQLLDRNGNVTVVYGLRRDPQAAAVEVTFNTRQTLRAAITPEGIFVLMADGSTAACKLRVLDPQNHVLDEVRVSDDISACP